MKSKRVCCICGAEVGPPVEVEFVGRASPPACDPCRQDARSALDRVNARLAAVRAGSTVGEGTR